MKARGKTGSVQMIEKEKNKYWGRVNDISFNIHKYYIIRALTEE